MQWLEEAVDTGHPDIADEADPAAHLLRHHTRLVGGRQVGRAGGEDADLAASWRDPGVALAEQRGRAAVAPLDDDITGLAREVAQGGILRVGQAAGDRAPALR